MLPQGFKDWMEGIQVAWESSNERRMICLARAQPAYITLKTEVLKLMFSSLSILYLIPRSLLGDLDATLTRRLLLCTYFRGSESRPCHKSQLNPGTEIPDTWCKPWFPERGRVHIFGNRELFWNSAISVLTYPPHIVYIDPPRRSKLVICVWNMRQFCTSETIVSTIAAI